jgi:protein arginine kinase
LQGDPTEFIGDIVAFHNSYTLGVTEENILSTLRMLATKFVMEEIGKRKSFKVGNETEVAEIKDKVSRAFAILMHSYQIEAIEALEAISLVKMGLDLEWCKGTTQAILNRLFFACRRGHLLCHYGEKISIEELPHRRAEFIHQTLHGLELLIT